VIEDPSDIIKTGNKIFPLALLTVASGIKNKLTLIHSLWQGKLANAHHSFALTGTTIRPTVLDINPQSFFKVATASVPTLDFFTELEEPNSNLDADTNQTMRSKISYSIALDPTTATILMSIDGLTANKAYQAILEYCFDQDTKTNPTWTQAELDEEENKITEDQIPTGELE
jgi:hypothetical protein